MNTITVQAFGSDNSFVRRIQQNPTITIEMLNCMYLLEDVDIELTEDANGNVDSVVMPNVEQYLRLRKRLVELFKVLRAEYGCHHAMRDQDEWEADCVMRAKQRQAKDED